MKISDSYKKAIYRAFIHTIFYGRDKESILKKLTTKVHGSDNVTIIPPIQDINVENVDVTHDKITFIYDDYSFDAIVTFSPCKDNKNFVFKNLT